MRSRSFPVVLLVAVLVATVPLAAQSGHVYVPGGVTNVSLPNGACAPTVPQIQAYPAPPLPGAGATLAGAMAIDHSTNLVYFTEGANIALVPHPLYPTPIIPPPPAPVPPATCPTAAFVTPFGPVTGMAVMPGGAVANASTILVTDGTCIMGLAPMPPYAIVIPPFPALAAAAAPPVLTGLEYDPVTGTIWACDATGTSYNIAMGGGLVQPPIPLPTPAVLSVIGNILDRSVPGGLHYLTDGANIYPMAGGPPIPVSSAGVAAGRGAAFSAEPVALPGACGCTGFLPVIGTSIPPVSPVPAAFEVYVNGAVPGTAAFLGVDSTCNNPPFAFGGGCYWWLPIPPAILIGPLVVNPVGSASVSFGPLPPAIGLVAYAQWVTTCPIAPSAPMITDALHVRISAP